MSKLTIPDHSDSPCCRSCQCSSNSYQTQSRRMSCRWSRTSHRSRWCRCRCCRYQSRICSPRRSGQWCYRIAHWMSSRYQKPSPYTSCRWCHTHRPSRWCCCHCCRYRTRTGTQPHNGPWCSHSSQSTSSSCRNLSQYTSCRWNHTCRPSRCSRSHCCKCQSQIGTQHRNGPSYRHSSR